MDVLNVIFLIIVTALAIVGIMYARKTWQDGQPQREHQSMKNRLSDYHLDNDEEEPDRDVVRLAKHNLQFAGVPDFDAGDILYHVPALDPSVAGKWDENQPIITTSRIRQLTKDGAVSLELFELGANGYAVLVKGQKAFVFKRYNMTYDQEQQLIQEREDACDRGDGKIESFLGQPWTIVMATGDMGGDFSTIQVLSTHPRIGQEGFISVLPPEVMDMKSHHYYDLEAKAPDGSIMVGFYCKGGWTLLIGRQLTEAERQALSAV